MTLISSTRPQTLEKITEEPRHVLATPLTADQRKRIQTSFASFSTARAEVQDFYPNRSFGDIKILASSGCPIMAQSAVIAADKVFKKHYESSCSFSFSNGQFYRHLSMRDFSKGSIECHLEYLYGTGNLPADITVESLCDWWDLLYSDTDHQLIPRFETALMEAFHQDPDLLLKALEYAKIAHPDIHRFICQNIDLETLNKNCPAIELKPLFLFFTLCEDAEALFLAGCCLEMGIAVKTSLPKALEYFHSAAKLGSSNALFLLGYYYLNGGEGVNTDEDLGVEFLKSASSQGCALASYNLGIHYQNKNILPFSLLYFKKAAEKGAIEAMHDLAMLYYLNYKHAAEAKIWFEKAAEMGDINSQYRLGWLLLRDPSPDMKKKGLYWLNQAAEQGSPNAKFSLGYYYQNKDPLLSMAWLKEASDQDLAKAHFNLALLYEKKYLSLVAEEEIFELYKKAAEKKLLKAYNHLAICYEMGKGTPKDSIKAFYWYTKGANLNSIPALGNLARIYQGEGKLKEAILLYEKAISLGDRPSIKERDACKAKLDSKTS